MFALRHLGLATGLVVGGAALFVACTESPYACVSDEQCSRDGAQGVCQPSGYCSFADEACASGQRYGEHAGKGLAGSCVAESEDDEGGDAAEDSTSGSTSGASAQTSDPDGGSASTTATSGSPTGPDDDGTTTGPTTSMPTSDDGAQDDDTNDAADDAAGDDGDGGDDTSGPTIECSFVDDFEGGMPSAAWNTGGQLVMFVQEGMFGVELGAPNKYGWAWTEEANLTGKSIRAEIGSPPPPSGSAQFLLELASPSLQYLMLLEGPELVARTSLDGDWENHAIVDFDIDAMRWVEISDLGETIRWSYSGNGTNWTTLASVTKAGSLSQAHIALVGGTWQAEDELGFVGVELVAICP